ncbi:MAG TPA: GTPase ObgE, partial [bacterium]|nr:GTPase ObgE [bacterium]
MFVDRVKVKVRAGSGGNGCISFRREKYVPHGGPDGGDGGHGGSIYFLVHPGETTLLNLHSRPSYRASDGGHGLGKCMHGADGQDIILEVPPGTVVHNRADMSLIGELLREGDRLLVARGGRGGRGNTHFKTPERQAPRRATPGVPGEERELLVELKLVAQGGLVGLPNSGKSTLLRRLTR